MRFFFCLTLMLAGSFGFAATESLKLFERSHQGKAKDPKEKAIEFEPHEQGNEQYLVSKNCFKSKKKNVLPKCEAVTSLEKPVAIPTDDKTAYTPSNDSFRCKLTGGQVFILIDDKLNEFESCRYKDQSSRVRPLAKDNDEEANEI